MVLSATFSASEVNLLIYHHLKESGFNHACFALRHESRLDDEPMSHEAVIEPGKLVNLLEKALLYMSVEAHYNEDGTEKACAVPMGLIGPVHACDESAQEGKNTSMEQSASASRLSPSPEPETGKALVETSVQTQEETKTASRESSAALMADQTAEANTRINGRRRSTESSSSKLASTSKQKLDAITEDSGPKETKRRGDAKAGRPDKKARRESTPRANGRAMASDGEEDEQEEPAVEKSPAPLSTAAPAKKKRRGGSTTKSSGPAGNGAVKSEKGKANAWVPPLTGKAKGKQVASQSMTRLKGHTAEVFVSAWNPAVPGLLASGAGDATVRIWDLGSAVSENGELGSCGDIAPTVCKHLPATHAKDVSALSWNPDGTLLASGSYDGILRLWTPQGDLHLVMSMHQGPIFAVRWNRKGNLILSGSADGTAIVWDLSSGKVRQQFSMHSDSVLDIEWLTASMSETCFASKTLPAAADATLASCSADNSINILRLGETRPVKTLKGHTDEVNGIRFDPTGTYLASVSDDATARVWNLDAILGSSYLGQSSSSSAQSSSLNGSSGNGIGKRNSVTPRPARGGSADHMEVDEEASASADRSADSIHLNFDGQNGSGNNGKQLCRHVLTGHKKDIFAVAWAPQTSTPPGPRILATASFDNTARIWNADDGSCLRVFQEHTDSVYSVCFSADRRFLVTGGMDHRLLISSVETGDVVLAHAGGGGVFDVAWCASRQRAKGKNQLLAPQAGVKAVKGEEEATDGDDIAANSSTLSSVPTTSKDSGDDSQSPSAGSLSGKQHLALSQADKTLTILDVSNL